jgi:hypothetical protein
MGWLARRRYEAEEQTKAIERARVVALAEERQALERVEQEIAAQTQLLEALRLRDTLAELEKARDERSRAQSASKRVPTAGAWRAKAACACSPGDPLCSCF